MVNEKTSFTIAFSVEAAVQAICGIVCLGNLWYYWWEKGNHAENKRMILGLTLGANLLLLFAGAFFLTETLAEDDALIDVYHAKYIFYLFAFGLLAWAIALFLEFSKRILAAFVLFTVLWWGALAVATSEADNSSARRWFFYGVSLVGWVTSLALLIFTAWWRDTCSRAHQVIPQSSNQPRTEEERIGRTAVRVCTFVLWFLHPIVWLLCPYAINVYSLLVLASIEVGWEFLALNVIAAMLLWWTSPVTVDMRRAVSRGGARLMNTLGARQGGVTPVVVYASGAQAQATTQ